jgi:hypothetical protein
MNIGCESWVNNSYSGPIRPISGIRSFCPEKICDNDPDDFNCPRLDLDIGSFVSPFACLKTIDLAIIAWLQCDDCVDGELDTLTNFNTSAVDPLIDKLEGPSLEELQNYHEHLTESFNSIRNYLFAHSIDSIDLSRSDYFEMYLSNFNATYQLRSALALGSIGDPKGEIAMRDMLNNDFQQLRPEVIEVLENVLSRF